MTYKVDTPEKGANRALCRTRTANTFRLHLLMEEAQRREIAERIRSLRENAPFGQEHIADQLGLKLRSYQKVEERGTTKYERCLELARVHSSWTRGRSEWAHVDADWLWSGRERGATPDPFAVPTEDRLDALTAAVADLKKQLTSTRTALLAEISAVRTQLEAQSKPQARGERAKGSSGK
jgi:transcriptional regulator with XRE-family HTH domain